MPDLHALQDAYRGWKRASRLHVLMPQVDAIYTQALGAHRTLCSVALDCGWRPIRDGEPDRWAERTLEKGR